MLKSILIWFFRITGLVMIANGIWMLADSLHWFYNIPAGVPDTGQPNGHFIRDVGLVYVILGVASTWSSFALAERRPVFLCVAAFMVGHATDHVIEILVGTLPPSHWLLDLPAVIAPGILFAVFVHPGAWSWLVQESRTT